ncbi:filament-like plant protein 3 [Spinacia oleracea]|uniref:Filament-like plant protein 3 n=1 Tax=Spinacia oleracea TaxID=3562 RepID=A0A9R0K1A1_SPIOL|nr:filament-like plant protein 3 [Spinacia oleracea]XP_021854108.2 filament-like plant protein 3 [Spinacia oleracea]XP_021854109.2 filament-like plant protein 3 [Spinacia oleracea]XP_021854110.2 filament-like plant protein 3 [Spinacia oleracea]
MDRRSWLWRRRSSDKSPGGETDSSISGSGSGSLSSPSERFSDEHQASPNQNTEVTSKVAPPDEDANDGVRILTEKLSAAIATISAKEELVKQHSKVAEEAVTGWEKADNEVVTLKQQLDIATKKNSALEDRIVHLDGALKECLRQLRHMRDDQDEKIQEALSKKSQDSESKKSELDVPMSDILARLETANAKVAAAASLESDLRLKLGSVEKENASLHLELRSRTEDLEIRTLERDLSTKSAETASKQHLESIKRVAKLEAECRRLKTVARKATSFNDSKSVNDSQSDSGERLSDYEPSHSDSWTSTLKLGKTPSKTHMAPPSPDIGLMDDFLEMEKLAALPENGNRSCSPGTATSIDKYSSNELDAMLNRIAGLEQNIETVESEKTDLASALSQCQNKLKISEAQLSSCQNQLRISQAQLREANKKIGMFQAELDLANELRQAIDLELDDANVRREEAESLHKAIEEERENLLSEISFLEGETEKERALYTDSSAQCRVLEDELSRMKHELETWKNQLTSMNKLKEAAESHLKDVNAETKSLLAKIGSLEKTAEKERQLSADFSAKCKMLENELSKMKHDGDTKSLRAKIGSLEKTAEKERQLSADFSAKCKMLENELSKMKHDGDTKSLRAKIGSLEKTAEKERQLSAEFSAKCKKLENELSEVKHDADTWQSQLASTKGSKDAVNQELQMTNAKKEEAETQLKAVLAKVGSLEHEVEKERARSSGLAVKCRKLEFQVSNLKSEAEFQLSNIKSKAEFQVSPISKEELDKQQEKELAVAATKMAECQKTIASLGNQLKSLAKLEDLFLDSENLLEVSEKESQLLHNDEKPDTLSSETAQNTSTTSKEDDQKSAKDDAKAAMSLEKRDKHGFGNLFSRTKSTARS